MARYSIVSSDELANLTYGPSRAQTRMYDAIGRNDGSNTDNFFAKRAKSLENAFGTTGAALVSAIDSNNENQAAQNILKNAEQSERDILKKYGYNNRDEYYDTLDALEASGDTATYDKLVSTVGQEIKDLYEGTHKEQEQRANDWADYRNNSYVGQKVNQDRGKFAGSAINTLSTMADVMLPAAGVAFNSVQGGIEGIADELEQNGLQNFDWNRAGQNALIGATTGAITSGLNRGISNQLAKNGGNLFKGGNALTRGLNNLGSQTALGRVGSTLATGAGRGAVSGAVGGATGAGLSAAMNGQDVLGSVAQGALQGAQQGAFAGGVMAGANMAANATPGVGNVMRGLNEAGENWKQSGDNFNERLTNTLTSGDSRVGEWLQDNRRSGLLQRAGGLGNRIQDVSDTPAQDAYARGNGSFSDALNEFIQQGGNIRRGANGQLELDNTRIESNNVDTMAREPRTFESIENDYYNTYDRLNVGDIYDELYDVGADDLRYALQGVGSQYGALLHGEVRGPKFANEYASEIKDGIKNVNKYVSSISDPELKTRINEYTSFIKNSVDDVNKVNYGNEVVNTVNNVIPKYIMDAYAIMRSDYNDPTKMQLETTPKGNLRLYYDGKDTGLTYRNNLSEATIDKLRDNGNWRNGTPTTAGGWLKQAGKRIVEDVNDSNLGMRVKDVAEQSTMPTKVESPETEVYRRLTGDNTSTEMELSPAFEPGSDTIRNKNKLQSIGDQLKSAAKTQKYSALYDSLDSKTAARAVQTGAPDKLASLGVRPENYLEAAKTSDYVNDVVSKMARDSEVKAMVPDLATKLSADNMDILMSDTAAKKYNNYIKQIVADGATPDEYSAGYLLEKSRELGRKAANLRGNTDDVFALRQALTEAKYTLRDVAANALADAEITGKFTNEQMAKGLAKKGANEQIQKYYTEEIDGKAPTVTDYIRRSSLFEQARDMGNQIEAEKYTRSASKAPTNPLTRLWTASGLEQPVNTLLKNTVAPVASGVTKAAGNAIGGIGDLAERAGRIAGGNTIDTTTPVETGEVVNTNYNPATRVYDAIGRTEGLTNAEQARTANYLTNAVEQATGADTGATTLESMVVPNTGANTEVYNQVYGGQTGTNTNVNTSNSRFPKTGDYWTDIVGVALTAAMAAGDAKAFGSLYEMYQSQLANLEKKQSSTSKTKLTSTQQRANAAMDSLNRLSNMTPDVGYNLSGIPVIGDIATLGGNDYEGEAKSLAQQIGYMVSGANIKEEEAYNIGKAYVPQPFDSEQTRKLKLQRAYNIIRQYQAGTADDTEMV